ncbi:MAG TPA: tripartite tricarboxylate transporter substrate-binding protein [Beijerinckiaceae bacterium]|jgi:tripartite-type tricarboxylate transporter receptor subunit TctC
MRAAIPAGARLAAAALLAGLLAAPAGAQDVKSFYAGRSINLIISTGAGGGLDANARLVARHMGRHIPGQPSIVPRNMPGAGHLAATNFMYNQAPRDGSHIAAILPSFILYKLIDGKGAQYDSARFNWIGSSDVDNMNVYVWSAAPVKSFADVKTTEILMGGTGAGSYTVLFPTLMNNLLGAKFKIVPGYKSTNEVHIAMERGEVQGRAGNFFSSLRSTNADWLRDGKITLIAQIGERRDPDFPDVPLLQDLTQDADAKRILRLFSAEIAMGRAMLTTPDTPPDRLAALRAAFDETMKDPAFLAEAKQAGMPVRPLGAAELSAIAQEIASTPKQLIERAAAARDR